MQRIELAVASVCDGVKGPRPEAFQVLAAALNWTTVIDERHGRLRLTVHTNNATCYFGVMKTFKHRGRHTSVHIIETKLGRGFEAGLMHPYMLSQQHYDSWERAIAEQPAPDVFAYLEDDNAISTEELLAWWHDTQIFEARGLLNSGFHRDLCRVQTHLSPSGAVDYITLSDVREWARLGPLHPGCSANFTCDEDVCVHFPLVYVRDGNAHRVFATATNAYSGVTIATRKQVETFLAFRRRVSNSSEAAVLPEPQFATRPGGDAHIHGISVSTAPPTKLAVGRFGRYLAREFGASGYHYSQRSLEMSPWINAAGNWWPDKGGFLSDESIPMFRALVPVKNNTSGRYLVEDNARTWHLGHGCLRCDRHARGGKIKGGVLAKCYDGWGLGSTAQNSIRSVKEFTQRVNKV